MSKIYYVLTLLIVSFNIMASIPIEGKEYSKIDEVVTNSPDVVLFFSFYCQPCMVMEEVYNVSERINSTLPMNTKVEKIHVSQMGPLGVSLTEAWSVAKVLGVEMKVEKPLFDAVQVKKQVKTESDIRQVFINSGVSPEKYDAAMKSFVVNSLTQKQIKAVEEYSVSRTPTYYVKGKYVVNTNVIDSSDINDYANKLAGIVDFLIGESNH